MSNLINAQTVDTETKTISLSNLLDAVDILHQERLNQAMSLEEFEHKSGFSWRSFYYWKSGSRQPRLGSIVSMAQALGYEIVMVKKNS